MRSASTFSYCEGWVDGVLGSYNQQVKHQWWSLTQPLQASDEDVRLVICCCDVEVFSSGTGSNSLAGAGYEAVCSQQLGHHVWCQGRPA